MTDAPLILWGRCRSGRRWFWAARNFDGPREHGWADSEELAVNAAEAAVERLAGGRAATVRVLHGIASAALRDVNAEKRKARPADGTATDVVEYLYGIEAEHGSGPGWTPTRVVKFRITKKTPRRIYYLLREWRDEQRFVDRVALERDGQATRKSGGWWEADLTVYLSPPVLAEAQQPSLAELKAAMAAAHPDRGGTDEAFVAARARYERARI